MVVDLSVDAEDEFPVGAGPKVVLREAGSTMERRSWAKIAVLLGRYHSSPAPGDGFVYSLITLVYAGLALRRVY